MLQSRQLAWPAYLVAAAMILIPLADAMTSLWPWNVGDARWRFGAVGLVSNALLIPSLGLLLAFVVAASRGQRLLVRSIGIMGFVGAGLCVLAIVFFALDALQTRSQVRPNMLVSFNVASITAALKTALAGATFLAFGFSGWRSSRGPSAKSSGAEGRLFTIPTAPSSMNPGSAEKAR